MMRMEQILGLLKVRVIRGVNLAVRDLRSSDPYVILRMGKQKLKTKVIKKNVNPEWDEDLTLSVVDPSLPVKLEVYDKDTFSLDDPMGHAEFDIQPFVEAVRVHQDVRDLGSSNPYIVLRMGKQEVYDKDMFSLDDPMGHAVCDIQPCVEAVRAHLDGVPNDTIIQKVTPNKSNCLADESKIYFHNGKVVQDIILRLRDVECGEVELQLQWVDVAKSRGY